MGTRNPGIASVTRSIVPDAWVPPLVLALIGVYSFSAFYIRPKCETVLIEDLTKLIVFFEIMFSKVTFIKFALNEDPLLFHEKDYSF